jgi:hypothetical protein
MHLATQDAHLPIVRLVKLKFGKVWLGKVGYERSGNVAK